MQTADLATANPQAWARYITHPSLWVRDKINIELAHYRPEEELLDFLADQPEEMHAWARRRLAAGQLTLAASLSYQAQALDRMASPGRYAFRWANGTAKTCTAALFVLWFFECFPGSKVITTAGSWSQLREQLWSEIPTWIERAKEPLLSQEHMLKTQIEAAPDWMVLARAANRADTFEGVHGQYIALLIDEAKAVKAEIFDAARRILRGNPGLKFWFVCLSSPGSPAGPFYDMCAGRQAHLWTTFHLSAYESERIPLEQIQDDRDELGEGSPLFTSMDLGEFPAEDEDTVIRLSWVEAAVEREVNTTGERVLGIDVARVADESIHLGLHGRRAVIEAAYRGKDTVYTANRARELYETKGFSRLGVDDTGVGGGVTDMLKSMPEIPPGVVVPVIFGEQARNPARFVNLKAEIYFALRDELEAGFRDPGNPDVGLSIPKDRRLMHQLTIQKFGYDSRNRLKIESKVELKARGVESPDRADALAIANYIRSRSTLPAGMMRRTVEAARHRGVAAEVINTGW